MTELVPCDRGNHRIRPGAFHICVDLTTPEPKLAPEPRVRKRQTVTSNRCPCGAPIGVKSAKCKRCSNFSRATTECGTVAGYERHRRLAKRDPANNPWPLPESDECGCLAAHLEKRGNSHFGVIQARIEEMAERYLAGETIRRLAEELDVSENGLRDALRKSGVKMRSKGEALQGRTLPQRHALTPEQVVQVGEAYLSGLSQTKVAEKFNVSQMSVGRALRKAGIPARSRSPKVS